MEVLRELCCQLWYHFSPCGVLRKFCSLLSAALYSVGGVRVTFTIGVGAGGPAAYWLVYLFLLPVG